MNSPSSKLPNLFQDAEKFIEEVESMDSKPLYELQPDEARKFLLDIQQKSHKQIDADIIDTHIATTWGGNVDLRVVRPKNNDEKLPAIIYLHGGGWVMGSKDTHDMLIRKLSHCTQSVVIFPEYTLAPQEHYPVAFNQIYEVLNYVYENPDEFNIDKHKIAIAGDSAGGNLATVAALKAKKENGPKIIFQALFYPVTDADMDTKSYESFQDGPWLSKKAMEWFWDMYEPDKNKRDDFYISPLKTPVEELAGMPPALIITVENDVLRDEGEAYARKLDTAGVNVMNVRVNGTIHDFMMLNPLFESQPTKGTFALACKVLRKILHG